LKCDTRGPVGKLFEGNYTYMLNDGLATLDESRKREGVVLQFCETITPQGKCTQHIVVLRQLFN